MYLPQFLNHPARMEEVRETFDVLGPVLLLGTDEQAATDQDSSTANLFRIHYLDQDDDDAAEGGGIGGNFTRRNVRGIVKMFGDLRYAGPNHSGAKILKDMAKEPVYYYSYR